MPVKTAPAKKTPARTVNGKPAGANVPYEITDQAIAERNKRANRVTGTIVITKDADFEQKLARMEREVDTGADPMFEVAEAHREANPDFSFRFLSDKVVKRRGTRGWKPLIDGSGDAVKVADMTLAYMPRQIADLRNEKYRRQGEDDLAIAQGRTVERQERLIHEAGSVGFAPLRPGDSFEDETQPDFTSDTIGFNRTRETLE